jgi:hypothetical protein
MSFICGIEGARKNLADPEGGYNFPRVRSDCLHFDEDIRRYDTHCMAPVIASLSD